MGFRTFLLAGGAALCMVAPAGAQTATDESGEDAIVVVGRYTIDEQIDTATGLGLSVRETPQSVTVVTAQRILDQNFDTVADVVRYTTGVSINEIDDIRNTFNGRGFEIKNYQVDGVPQSWFLAGDSAETIADASIYERIEIVRGATGLLTGAGDPSASINLVRKHADSGHLTGYVTASMGSWDSRQIEGDVTTPLNADGSIRARLVGRLEDSESYMNLFEVEKSTIYGVIDADLSDSTSVRVGASHQQTNPMAQSWGALPSFYDDGSFALWPRNATTSARWSYWDTENTNYFANLTHEFSNGWRATVDLNRTINAADTKLLYLSGWINRTTGGWETYVDDDSNPLTPSVPGTSFAYPFKSSGESVQDSIDIQLSGDYSLFGREHEFTVGAMYSTQDAHTITYDQLSFPDAGNFFLWDGSMPDPGFSAAPNLSPARGAQAETEQTGYFAATRLNITDQFKIIGGARVSSWDRTGYSYGADDSYGEDDVVVPYVGALYDLTPQHRLYASYTEIFQPQNLRDINNAPLPSIVGEAWELGLKSAFFNDALQTSIAVFHIVQDGLGQSTGLPIPGALPPETAYFASEGATSEGFEIEVIGRLTENWNISAGYSQFDVTDATGDDVNTDQPREIFTLFTTYNLGGALDALTVGGGVRWQSEMYSDSFNIVTGAPFRFEQGDYSLVSLMARYDLTDAVSVQANMENVLDETYFSQIGFYGQYRYGAPSNYTVSLTYRF